MQQPNLANDGVAQDTVPTGKALLPENNDFRLKFNRSDFMFDHGLAYHPLFELPKLAALAARIPDHRDFRYWQNGRVKVNEKWGANPAPRLSLDDTIRGIASNDSLVLLKHAEQDEIYGPLLQEILQRIWSFIAPEAQADVVLGESLIFINSPNRKTAYHLDLESNFLLQITGEKLIHVFDCRDRTITPHEEIENQCAGDANGAVYKPEMDHAAHSYRLTPGHGVHFPSLGPHWVQNGPELSISININYDLTSIHHRLRRVYRMNRMLRRFGLKPTPPGESPVLDTLKTGLSVAAGSIIKSVNNLVKPADEADTYPHWRPRRHATSPGVPNTPSHSSRDRATTTGSGVG